MNSQGLNSLLGKTITVFSQIYIYTGKVKEVASDHILLENASLVYETGPFNTPDWKNAQPLPHDWYVSTGAIESFGIMKQ